MRSAFPKLQSPGFLQVLSVPSFRPGPVGCASKVEVQSRVLPSRAVWLASVLSIVYHHPNLHPHPLPPPLNLKGRLGFFGSSRIVGPEGMNLGVFKTFWYCNKNLALE